jgi:hypothetical protein
MLPSNTGTRGSTPPAGRPPGLHRRGFAAGPDGVPREGCLLWQTSGRTEVSPNAVCTWHAGPECIPPIRRPNRAPGTFGTRDKEAPTPAVRPSRVSFRTASGHLCESRPHVVRSLPTLRRGVPWAQSTESPPSRSSRRAPFLPRSSRWLEGPEKQVASQRPAKPGLDVTRRWTARWRRPHLAQQGFSEPNQLVYEGPLLPLRFQGLE